MDLVTEENYCEVQMAAIRATTHVEKAIDQSKHCKKLAMNLLDQHHEKDAARLLLDAVELCIKAASLDMYEAAERDRQQDLGEPLFETAADEEDFDGAEIRQIMTLTINGRLNAVNVKQAFAEIEDGGLHNGGPYMMIWDLTEADVNGCSFADVCQMIIMGQSVVDFLSPESIIYVKDATDAAVVRLWHHWMKDQLNHSFHVFTSEIAAKEFARQKVTG